MIFETILGSVWRLFSILFGAILGAVWRLFSLLFGAILGAVWRPFENNLGPRLEVPCCNLCHFVRVLWKWRDANSIPIHFCGMEFAEVFMFLSLHI